MRKIIVVGSGVIGLSCALFLALDGHKVQVITRNPEEATSWVAGGMLAPFSEGLKGEFFDFSYTSLKEYPGFISLLKEVSGQGVDFWTEGIYRVVLKGEEGLVGVAQNYRERGYGVEIEETPGVVKLSEHVIAIIRYAEEAWVDVEMLMDALLSAMGKLGVELIIDEITQVVIKERRVRELRGLKSLYSGDFYVFSPGAWTRKLFDLPLYPVKGQSLKLKGISLPRVFYSSVSYLIPRRAYLYVGATSEDVGFLGGNTLEGISKLSEGVIRVAPFLSRAHITGMLYGYRPATPDEKPIFEAGENYFLATGHYRNGILHAPATAQVVSNYLKGENSQFIGFFSPDRFS